jgi:hypothetical protein
MHPGTQDTLVVARQTGLPLDGTARRTRGRLLSVKDGDGFRETGQIHHPSLQVVLEIHRNRNRQTLSNFRVTVEDGVLRLNMPLRETHRPSLQMVLGIHRERSRPKFWNFRVIVKDSALRPKTEQLGLSRQAHPEKMQRGEQA